MSTLVIRQRATDLDELEHQLLEHFLRAREALLGGSAVSVEVRVGDLLGQGAVADAALAHAMLGVARALAIEGARPGWLINTVAVGDDGLTAPTADSALAETLGDLGVTGQLVYGGSEQLGRVPS